MINFIYGRAGSGKTRHICELAAESLSRDNKVFLIVPEQMAVEAEARMTDLIGEKPSLNLEILNFRRLCNRVFREYGGLSYNYVTKSGKLLLMWQTLLELAPMLNCETPVTRSEAEKMLSAVAEFKSYNVTPHALERAAKELSDDEAAKKLKDKLSDLSLIFAAYTNAVRETLDDAADDLSKAAELLHSNGLFSGADVFLDSFNGFTPQELSVIDELFASAENVTLSLCLDVPPETAGDELFYNQRTTAATLKRMAARHNAEICETTLTGNYRTDKDALKFIERTLWSLDITADGAYSEETDDLSLVMCTSLFSECEAVAADILRRVRGGAMWKDFTVITRGVERYDGILDVILEKYGIPHFASKRVDIKTRPPVKLILSALSLGFTNFRTPDVVSYIKTGLTGLTPDEVSELENYAELWRIRGQKRWSNEWTMNPSGYTAVFTEESQIKLERINELRERVIIPLSDLHDALSRESTPLGYSKALYSYLIALDIPTRLSETANKLKKYDQAAASEAKQLWGVLVSALDELCAIMPDVKIDLSTYCELLKIIFDSTDIGRIPNTVDEVVSGDATQLRKASKHVYIIGANEGIFPLAPKSEGIFTDADRELLASVGVTLAGGIEYRSADERFAFYKALTSASESLTVVWSCTDLAGHAMKPSFGASRLCSLFPKVKVINYSELPLTERLEGRSNILEYAAEASVNKDHASLHAALVDYVKRDEDMKKRLEKLSLPLFESENLLSPETAKKISGGDLALTQSRLDSYVLCHFSYFCKYLLKLEERKPAKFDASDIGTFVHHILEVFVSGAESRGGLANITPDELDKMVDDIVADYMKTICRISPDLEGSRLAHLFARLKRSSKLLCKSLAAEFSQSRFRPAFFELPICPPEDGKESVSPLKIKLDDGTDAYVYGIADRVDILEHEDKLYVRVVDYKTGQKKFSLEDVSMGLGMQMLLYLFSIWKNGGDSKNAFEFVKNREIVPAGILYFSAGVPTVSLDAEAPPEEIEKMASKGLTRRGLLLDDPEILEAMDKELSGAYLPIRQKKDGTFTGSDSLTSLEGFSHILSSVEKTIKDIGREIKRGNASAKPLKTKEHDACAYCEMRPICRNTKRKGGDE